MYKFVVADKRKMIMETQLESLIESNISLGYCINYENVDNEVTGVMSKVKTLGKWKNLFQNLQFLLDKQRVYLNAQLSLSGLSKMLFTNTTYLSKVINIYFGCNFKTLVNRYRIAYAKRILEQEDCDLGHLPAQCGFLSRSAFYASFSKFEGQTPTDYRLQVHNLRLRTS